MGGIVRGFLCRRWKSLSREQRRIVVKLDIKNKTSLIGVFLLSGVSVFFFL